MTVSIVSVKVIALGNGAQSVFTYTFPIPVGADYQLIYTDANGVETVLAASAFSITGIGTPGGGTFTYAPSGTPIAAGTTLTLVRMVPYEQLTDFTNQNTYNPAVLTAALDWIVEQTQQLFERTSRALRTPVVENDVGTLPSAALRANKFLAFDANGAPVMSAGTGGANIQTTRDFDFFFEGKPLTAQCMFSFVFNRAITFPVNMTGSHAAPRVAFTGTVVITLAYNGVTIGTLTLAAGVTGAAAATWAVVNSLVTAAGGVLTGTFQVSTDATGADTAFALSGTG